MPRFFKWSLCLRYFWLKYVYACLISPRNIICPTHSIYLDFVILRIFGEKRKLWSSSQWNFLQPPLTSCLLHTDILARALLLNTCNVCLNSNTIAWNMYTHGKCMNTISHQNKQIKPKNLILTSKIYCHRESLTGN